jgi:hypothetical protein
VPRGAAAELGVAVPFELIDTNGDADSHRRSGTKVQSGRTLRKNNWRLDRDDHFAVPQVEIRIDRRDPGRGYRHLITVAHLRLLPDWELHACRSR